MRILGARMLGERDCLLHVQVGERTYELTARRVGLLAHGIEAVGDFEPAGFRDLPLSATQVRALVRTAVRTWRGAASLLPLDVPDGAVESEEGGP